MRVGTRGSCSEVTGEVTSAHRVARMGNRCHPRWSSVEYRDMKNAQNHDERIARMTFSLVYPLYLAKVEKKGRTKEELHRVITWLTGYGENKLQQLLQDKMTFEQFFREATLNPNAQLITGVICGYRVEQIENPLTQQVRYLDKLVDELAKGRQMEKILRVV